MNYEPGPAVVKSIIKVLYTRLTRKYSKISLSDYGHEYFNRRDVIAVSNPSYGEITRLPFFHQLSATTSDKYLISKDAILRDG